MKGKKNISRTDGSVITFGEATTRGIEAHKFNCNVSLRITTFGKRRGGNNGNSISEKTITESAFSVVGATTIATNKFHAGDNLEDDDGSSFGSSISTMQSRLDNMDVFRRVS